jgi:hypothetical protein
MVTPSTVSSPLRERMIDGVPVSGAGRVLLKDQPLEDEMAGRKSAH